MVATVSVTTKPAPDFFGSHFTTCRDVGIFGIGTWSGDGWGYTDYWHEETMRREIWDIMWSSVASIPPWSLYMMIEAIEYWDTTDVLTSSIN